MENTLQNITLTGFDQDKDSLSFSVIREPKHGTLEGTPPNLTYIAEDHYVGEDSFLFQAEDGTSISKPAIVKINILPTNDYPAVKMGRDLTLEIGEYCY